MVVVVDLGEEEDHSAPATRYRQGNEHKDGGQNDLAGTITPFSTALACYPVVLSLASHLDLNTLHDLAATCRQFRYNLLRFRSQLIKRTLRCINDESPAGLGGRQAVPTAGQARVTLDSQPEMERMTNGRIGQCARDMVSECRRCKMIVCRNCTVRQPPSRARDGRLRRLCRVCQEAFLQLHNAIPPRSSHMQNDSADLTPFTFAAFAKEPCGCSQTVYLCLSCGNVNSSDLVYSRIWSWRTRYRTHLGTVGSGLGEGSEGVGCGKLEDCLAAHEVEKEIDCEAEEFTEMWRETALISSTGRTWQGTSYYAQEMEGIGGVVKRKVKHRVKVGAVVKEYDDEKESGKHLEREQSGALRAWCSWCSRIVLSKDDCL